MCLGLFTGPVCCVMLCLQELLEALKHVGDIEHYVAVLKREAAALDRVLGQVTPVLPLPAQQTPASTEQQDLHTTSATAAAAAEEAVGAESEAVTQQQQEENKATAQTSLKASVAQPDQQDQQDDSVQLPVSSRASR